MESVKVWLASSVKLSYSLKMEEEQDGVTGEWKREQAVCVKGNRTENTLQREMDCAYVRRSPESASASDGVSEWACVGRRTSKPRPSEALIRNPSERLSCNVKIGGRQKLASASPMGGLGFEPHSLQCEVPGFTAPTSSTHDPSWVYAVSSVEMPLWSALRALHIGGGCRFSPFGSHRFFSPFMEVEPGSRLA
ncbi:hypothetical protein LXL04_016160 [Taraxacum kok-saghyz]